MNMQNGWSSAVQRPLALFLAALLTLSLMPISALNVEADRGNLVEKGSFDGDLSGWKSVPVSGYTGYFTWQEGKAKLSADHIFSIESEKMLEVSPTGTYRLSYDAQLSLEAELSAYIYYCDKNGASCDIPYQRVAIAIARSKDGLGG